MCLLTLTLTSKEIQPVHPKGNWSWIFIGRTDVEAETLIPWPPDAKNRLIWKDPDAGKNKRQEEKGTTEDESILKEISPEYSLEGLMLKLKP